MWWMRCSLHRIRHTWDDHAILAGGVPLPEPPLFMYTFQYLHSPRSVFECLQDDHNFQTKKGSVRQAFSELLPADGLPLHTSVGCLA